MAIHSGIRSREGNAIVGALGGTYTLAALLLLIFHVVDTLHARTLLESAIDVLLISAVVLGGWLVIESLHALGILKH